MRRIYEPHAYTDGPRADCFWAAPPQDFPSLEGDEKAEFAIIGGGYSGLSAALELAERGASVMLLEAKAPGWGASGRNGGFCCLGGAGLEHDAIIRKLGAEAAQEFLRTERAAIELVAETLATHQIDADTHSDGEMVLAHRPKAAADLRHEAEIMASIGVETRLLSPGDLAEQGMAGPFHGGLHVRLGFGLDPAKYAYGLARAAQTAGADIRAESPVTQITRENGSYVLTTPRGRLTARRLIVATNGYSSDDVPEWLAGRYLPLQSNIIVTRPLSADERAAAGGTSDIRADDSRVLLHYFRLLPDGRFLFGRRGALTAGPASQARMRQKVLQHFHRMFPAWRAVEVPFFWSGFVNLAYDQLPHIAPIDGWEGAWAAMAWHGNGVAMASWAGRQVARAALDGAPVPTAMAQPLPRFPLGRARRALLYPALGWYALRDRL
ncbi:MAG TPA: FAD-binding oxidoreductase [Aliiroseovarius sp.]|nr:FAD-binding oxidoreductase [Aliiroseovarius sp.]